MTRETQYLFEFKAYFARNCRDATTLKYLKKGVCMSLREAITLAVSTFFYPAALEYFGAPAEEVEKAKQMSRQILLNAYADMGGFEAGVPQPTKASVALPVDDEDDFDDAFN